MGNKTKHVFISHIHKDDAGLADLKSLLKNKGMEVKDSSINSERPNDAKSPEYIKTKILAPAIDWASTLIVYVSPATKQSDWVNWEIERAHIQGKTIVGVWERGANGCDVPDALEEYANALVGWNAQKIIDAISGDYEQFERPDGTLREPRPIKRHPCG